MRIYKSAEILYNMYTVEKQAEYRERGIISYGRENQGCDHRYPKDSEGAQGTSNAYPQMLSCYAPAPGLQRFHGNRCDLYRQ